MDNKYKFEITESTEKKQRLHLEKNEENVSLSILMPPPNITGNLHIGHTLDLAIQDFIVRSTKIRNKEINWISGFDHAGIATQSVLEISGIVSGKNRAEKIDFTLNQWYPERAQKFIEQWRNLGLKLDYQQLNFTMDEHVQKEVRDYFVKLYNDKLIYRSTRLVNWDSKLETVLSDIETSSEETDSTLYHIRYPLLDEKQFVTVATSRPETIFSDVALFINPTDIRNHKYLNKVAINPLTGKQIPILADGRVTTDFGTGVLKCTPAHDFKDYEIAKENNLPIIPCYDKSGIFNELAGKWEGKNFRTVKNEIISHLYKTGFLVKQEKYKGKRVFSQRSGETIEALLSLQWFLDLPSMIKKIEKENPNFLDQIDFLPSDIKKNLEDWKLNIKEWCISRQLWWGHQIPAWHNKKGEVFVGFELPDGDWTKDKDVLDTWFSSSLWPLLTTTTESSNFEPLSYLVTGSDLLFFWLFKMITFSFYFHQKPPFLKVIIHGLVRDETGKKMSKSKGNGIEQEKIISKYGMDSLRLFLLSNNSAGNDITFDSAKLKGCYFFLQKIWSISHFIIKNLPENLQRTISSQEAISALEEEENSLLKSAEEFLLRELWNLKEKFDIQLESKVNTSQIAFDLMNFAKEDISSHFIPFLRGLETTNSHIILNYTFQQLLILLNPFVPFISDYLYEKHTSSKSLKLDFNYQVTTGKSTQNQFTLLNLLPETRNAIKSFHAKNKSLSEDISFRLDLLEEWLLYPLLVEQIIVQIRRTEKMNISLISKQEKEDNEMNNSIDLSPFGILRFSLKKKSFFNSFSKLKSAEFYQQEIERSQKLLNNKKFLEKAPHDLVNLERKKLANYCEQREKILKKKVV